MQTVIPIFYTIDNNFAPFVAVSIASLLENSSNDCLYKIHVVSEDISDINKDKILKLKKDNSEIIFIKMKDGLETIKDNSDTKLREDYFTLSIFYRLFISDMFKEYDKGIYIDADTVLNDDIKKLYNIDLEENVIGGCSDTSCYKIKPITNYFTNAVGVHYKEYINSGVLLMDMKKLRELNFSEKFLYLFNKYHFENVDPDQSYINAMCKGKIKHLDTKWNTMPTNDGEHVTSNPSLIHYNLFYKPWHYDGIMFEEYFWKYAKLTSFYEEIIEIKKSYTEEDIISDKLCLEHMLKRCNEIVKSEVTFKKVFENNIEERL